MELQSIAVTAHLESNACELYIEDGEVMAYIPTKADPEAILGLSVCDYVAAEIKARAMGLEPKWNV